MIKGNTPVNTPNHELIHLVYRTPFDEVKRGYLAYGACRLAKSGIGV